MTQDRASVIDAKYREYVKKLHFHLPVSGEVHVWYASLDRPVSNFQDSLSSDERDRARRFIFAHDRERYIVRHGILRMILSGYLGIEPSGIRLDCSNNKKPTLADKNRSASLFFNLSRSESIAVYAFTKDREIGIDIEQIKHIPNMEQMFERVFSPRENEVFQILPESKRKEAFFICWTRKEAFLKAIGGGLSRSLDEFDMTLVPDQPARLLSIKGNQEEVPLWSIHDLKGAPGYAAALALKGSCCDIYTRQWPE